MTVQEIIKEKLSSLGAAGLCNPEQECGCGIADLFPCDCCELTCEPATKRAIASSEGEDGPEFMGFDYFPMEEK